MSSAEGRRIMESSSITMQRNNSKGKNKSSLFLCFKPVTADDDSDEGGKERRRKTGGDNWKALRAAFNDTSLMKRINSRRQRNKDNISRSNSNLNLEQDNKTSSPQRKSTSRTSSNASSTFGSSSSRALTSSSSNSSSTSSLSSRADFHASGSPSHEITPLTPLSCNNRNKHKRVNVENRKRGCRISNKATCMLLISLLVLIMWGKCLAIVYTSIGFYMVRPLIRRRPSNNYSEGAIVYGQNINNEFDSVQHKRKVIMQGLLERSNSRVSLFSSSMKKRGI